MAIFFLMGALASAVHAQDFTYTTNSGSITITGYTGAGGDIIIPDTINGLPVISVDFRAFYRKTSIARVTIPDSITSIGTEAFWGCTNLTTITIPNSVTYIGQSAFGNCLSLAGVIIPDGVSTIWDKTFQNCTSLTSGTIGNSVISRS